MKPPYPDEHFDIRMFKISLMKNEQSPYEESVSFGYYATNERKSKFIKYTHGLFQIESKEDVISSVNLSSTEDLFKIKVKSVVSNDSLNLGRIIFKLQNGTIYNDLLSYWALSKDEYDRSYRVLYLDNHYTDRVHLPVLGEDLASTSLIQMNHPEVQRMKKELLNSDLIKKDMKERSSKKPSRKLLLVLIQKYISENFELEPISFKNMPDFRLVEEVLESKSGNSQDLSLVFIALARSLGIPSHLAVGYQLTEPFALPSVWVEAQVRDLDSQGYWMGIDFKSDGGMMLKNIKNVIPVSKGLLIEQGKRTLKQTLDTYKNGGEITILKPKKS